MDSNPSEGQEKVGEGVNIHLGRRKILVPGPGQGPYQPLPPIHSPRNLADSVSLRFGRLTPPTRPPGSSS